MNTRIERLSLRDDRLDPVAIQLRLEQAQDQPHALQDCRTVDRASPRGAQCLILAAKARALLDQRYNVAFQDIRAVAIAALRHRVKRNLSAEVAGVTQDDLVQAVLDHVYEE